MDFDLFATQDPSDAGLQFLLSSDRRIQPIVVRLQWGNVGLLELLQLPPCQLNFCEHNIGRAAIEQNVGLWNRRVRGPSLLQPVPLYLDVGLIHAQLPVQSPLAPPAV